MHVHQGWVLIMTWAVVQVVTAPDQADFILASGTEALGHGDDAPAEDISLDGVRQLLEQCAARGGIPMLVANPDVVTVSRSGLIPMPGTFAQWYAKLGGEVSSSPLTCFEFPPLLEHPQSIDAAFAPCKYPYCQLACWLLILTQQAVCRCICWASQHQ